MSSKIKTGVIHKVFILFGVILLISSYKGEIDNKEKRVKIITDKIEYNQSEVIIITIKNNLKDSIYSHIGSLTPLFAIQFIERKTKNKCWEKLYAYCQYPHCIYDIDVPQVINPGQSESMKWDPLIFINGTSKTEQLDPGQYRVLILYLDSAMKNWKSEYSNLFIIN